MSGKRSSSERDEREEVSTDQEDNDTEAPNEYELQRAERIRQNNIRMQPVNDAANAL